MARLAGIFGLFVTLTACSGDGEIRMATVVGEVTYLEPITLPTDARLHVTLRTADVATGPSTDATGRAPYMAATGMVRPDQSRVVAQHSGAVSGPVPFPFTLRYDAGSLDPMRLLIVEAWISAGEQVLFASTEPGRLQVDASTPLRLTLRRPRRISLTCADGSHPTAAFPAMGELAFLETGGTPPVALRALPAASGFRYGGNGYGLRGRGKDMFLRRPSGGETPCEANLPSPATQISIPR